MPHHFSLLHFLPCQKIPPSKISACLWLIAFYLLHQKNSLIQNFTIFAFSSLSKNSLIQNFTILAISFPVKKFPHPKCHNFPIFLLCQKQFAFHFRELFNKKYITTPSWGGCMSAPRLGCDMWETHMWIACTIQSQFDIIHCLICPMVPEIALRGWVSAPIGYVTGMSGFMMVIRMWTMQKSDLNYSSNSTQILWSSRGGLFVKSYLHFM